MFSSVFTSTYEKLFHWEQFCQHLPTGFEPSVLNAKSGLKLHKDVKYCTYLIVWRNLTLSLISSGILLRICLSARAFSFRSWNSGSGLSIIYSNKVDIWKMPLVLHPKVPTDSLSKTSLHNMHWHCYDGFQGINRSSWTITSYWKLEKEQSPIFIST